ncbi:MAG: type II secretion system F family protein [Candidatus Woesearchaeota archaeon]|nr:MAG: type II secretion system F family protein [Candidatus Woesearchaeota archaeon]
MKLKKEKESPSLYRKISARLFLKFVSKNIRDYEKITGEYMNARMKALFEVYLSTIYFTSILVFVILTFAILLFLSLLGYPLFFSISFAILISLICALATFLIMYKYPKMKGDARKQDIEVNLPFAIIYMAGVSESGVPPQNIFKMLSKAEGFGEVSEEAKYIVYLMEERNYGLMNALAKCASITPSQSFKEFILSLVMTIKYGGDIELFLKTEANRKEMDYRLKAKEYQEKLTMYSTIYTGLFIAAPVLFISMFSLMNFFSPIGGVDILKEMILFGLPLVNTMYIYYLHITQPEL